MHRKWKSDCVGSGVTALIRVGVWTRPISRCVADELPVPSGRQARRNAFVARLCATIKGFKVVRALHKGQAFTHISSRCQRQRLYLLAEMRRFLISLANNGPERHHHSRTVSWQISIPRSNSKSSTWRSDSGNRTAPRCG